MTSFDLPPSTASGPGRTPRLRRTLAVGVAIAIGVLAFNAGAYLGRAKSKAPLEAPVSRAAPVSVATLPTVRLADFGRESPSPDARHLAHWIADSHDNAESDFVIIDKKFAKVYVFYADARLHAASPVLIGSAVGDDSVAGIGSRPIAQVRPHERTTPAGRFIGERGRNSDGEDVVWVDYNAAVSMHRLRVTDSRERRRERLASPTADDNRISFGCINVPAAFYDAYIRPTFARQRALVYVLPEIKPVQQVFGSYPVPS